MLEQVKKNLTKFFENNYDVMAYNPSKKKGVSPVMIVHRLNVKAEAKARK